MGLGSGGASFEINLMKKALILDLDNTIYPVNSISDNLFARLFKLIDENPDGIDASVLEQAKDDLTRRHFHLVADKYKFSPELKNKGIAFLKELTG